MRRTLAWPEWREVQSQVRDFVPWNCSWSCGSCRSTKTPCLVPQGFPVFLVLTVTGLPRRDGLSFSHVTLLGAHGEKLQTVTLNSSSSLSSSSPFFPSVDQLVGRLDPVPKVPFCVQLTGQDNTGHKFERVSTEMVHPTHVQIQVALARRSGRSFSEHEALESVLSLLQPIRILIPQVKSSPRLVPGHSTMVDFEVLNHGPARLFSLVADDDHGYLQKKGPHRWDESRKETETPPAHWLFVF